MPDGPGHRDDGDDNTDDEKKIMGVFELVVPYKYNKLTVSKKKNKYNNLLSSQIKNYQVLFLPFAVGSVTGLLSLSDKRAIKTLHEFCKKDVRKIQFLRDIQSLASLEYKKLLHILL